MNKIIQGEIIRKEHRSRRSQQRGQQGNDVLAVKRGGYLNRRKWCGASDKDGGRRTSLECVGKSVGKSLSTES